MRDRPRRSRPPRARRGARARRRVRRRQPLRASAEPYCAPLTECVVCLTFRDTIKRGECRERTGCRERSCADVSRSPKASSASVPRCRSCRCCARAASIRCRCSPKPGLTPACFADPDNVVPYATLGRLVAASVRATRLPDWGLRVGAETGVSALGIIGFLVQNSPDVGSALRNLVEHLHLHDRGASPTLRDRERHGVARLHDPPERRGGRRPHRRRRDRDRLQHDARHVRRGLGADVRAADASRARRYVALPQVLSRARAVRRRPERADVPGALAGAAAARRQRRDCAGCWSGRSSSSAVKESGSVDHMRRVLRTLLHTGEATEERLAHLFAMHRRTVNRRLQAQGTTFRKLVDEVRYDVARHLLESSELPVIDIAGMLNYADASAFTRAFRRWSGTTPAQWRAGRGSAATPVERAPRPRRRCAAEPRRATFSSRRVPARVRAARSGCGALRRARRRSAACAPARRRTRAGSRRDTPAAPCTCIAQSITWQAMFGAATLIIAISLRAALLPTVSIFHAACSTSRRAWSIRMRALAMRSCVTVWSATALAEGDARWRRGGTSARARARPGRSGACSGGCARARGAPARSRSRGPRPAACWRPARARSRTSNSAWPCGASS